MQTVSEEVRPSPADEPPSESSSSTSILSWLGWEKAAFIVIILVATGLRFWDLGSRAFHHDESLHALYSWYLYTGRGYIHDPLMHGPFQFHATAFMFMLFGDNDYTARILPALLGTVAVGIPFFLRGALGRTGALCTAVFLAVSPSVLYYSRFLREDMYVFLWTFILFVAIWHYLQTGKKNYAILGAIALSLGFATKESTYLTVLIFGSYLGITSIRDVLPRLRRFDFRDAPPKIGMLIILGTLSLPQGAAASMSVWKILGIDAVALGTSVPAQFLIGLSSWWSSRAGVVTPVDPAAIGKLVAGAPVVLALLGFTAFIGWRWNWSLWVKVAAAFYIPYAVLFTTVFTNLPGLTSGIWGGLDYWMAQQGVQRGGQPWFYYLMLLPSYEFLPVVLAFAGVIVHVIRARFRDQFANMLVWWVVGALLLYGYAGEKMPWLSIHIALPLILLAGKTLGGFIETAPWRTLWQRGALPFAASIPLLFLALHAFLESPAQPMALLQTLAAALATMGLALVVIQHAQSLGFRLVSYAIASLCLTLLMALSLRTALTVTYAHGDIASEMLVYTQTSPAIPGIMRNIDRIANESSQGKNMSIEVDAADGFTWPWAWYLRNYKNVGYPCYGVIDPIEGCKNTGGAPNTLMTHAPAAAILLMNSGDDAGALPHVGAYTAGERFPHRWWFPEHYRDLTISGVIATLFDPKQLGDMWHYFYLRELNEPLGSSDGVVYYPKGFGAGGTTAPSVEPPPSSSPPAESAPMLVDKIIGSKAAPGGSLVAPRGVAVNKQGDVYVVDSQTNRVTKFDAQGQVIAQIGKAGQGAGEFTEPWGIAIDNDGNVYVADTWNHRIQKFNANLNFITAWGFFANVPSGGQDNPGGMYGPRSLVVDPKGNIWVTDTGNKRVQQFSPTGQPVLSFGSLGTGTRQFREPVGIAIDAKGDFWVADTWNRRVQHFDSAFNFVSQFPVDSWQGERILNKPYLAVDNKGNLLLTDPEQHRLLRYSPEGKLLQTLGKFGSDQASFNLPAEVTVDSEGYIYVSDSGNGRILRLASLP